MASESPGRARKKAMGGDLVLPLMAFLFAIYYLITIWDLTWEAQLNGLMIGSVLIALVVALFVRTFLRVGRGEADLGLGPLLYPLHLQALRLALFGLCALYIFVIQWLGFTLTTFLFCATCFYLLGVRSLPKLVGLPLLLAASGYGLFVVFLKARFPWGPVENFLGWLVL